MRRIPYELPGPREMWQALLDRARRVDERLEDPAVQAEIARAREEADRVARLLKGEYGATRVRLHGSLARLDHPEGFDIDIAVEGIEPERFFEAYGKARALASRKLDLVDLRDAMPLLRQRIEEDGIDLP